MFSDFRVAEEVEEAIEDAVDAEVYQLITIILQVIVVIVMENIVAIINVEKIVGKPKDLIIEVAVIHIM